MICASNPVKEEFQVKTHGESAILWGGWALFCKEALPETFLFFGVVVSAHGNSDGAGKKIRVQGIVVMKLGRNVICQGIL